MAKKRKAAKKKTEKTKITVKSYTRAFSAAKLPPRENDGKWRPKRAQRELFGR